MTKSIDQISSSKEVTYVSGAQGAALKRSSSIVDSVKPAEMGEGKGLDLRAPQLLAPQVTAPSAQDSGDAALSDLTAACSDAFSTAAASTNYQMSQVQTMQSNDMTISNLGIVSANNAIASEKQAMNLDDTITNLQAKEGVDNYMQYIGVAIIGLTLVVSALTDSEGADSNVVSKEAELTGLSTAGSSTEMTTLSSQAAVDAAGAASDSADAAEAGAARGSQLSGLEDVVEDSSQAVDVLEDGAQEADGEALDSDETESETKAKNRAANDAKLKAENSKTFQKYLKYFTVLIGGTLTAMPQIMQGYIKDGFFGTWGYHSSIAYYQTLLSGVQKNVGTEQSNIQGNNMYLQYQQQIVRREVDLTTTDAKQGSDIISMASHIMSGYEQISSIASQAV